MKPPNEWDEDYLLNLPSLEPTNLDFKGRGGLDLTLQNVNRDRVKNELSVEISAFANSGGGLIIFGVKNPVAGQPLVIDDGGVDIAMKGSSTKEWLENIIPDLTEYSLPSFEIHVIEGKKPNSQISPGRAVFVVEVPDSERAPHQAKDHKYYVRIGGTSQPIGHRFVMDIAGRRQYPDIQLKFTLETEYYDGEKTEGGVTTKGMLPRNVLKVRATNEGRVYAQYVNCHVDIPVQLIPEDKRRHIVTERIGNDAYYKWHLENIRTESGSSYFFPILPSQIFEWTWIIPADLPHFAWDTQSFVRWKVFADNSPVKEGRTPVRDILNHVS